MKCFTKDSSSKSNQIRTFPADFDNGKLRILCNESKLRGSDPSISAIKFIWKV